MEGIAETLRLMHDGASHRKHHARRTHQHTKNNIIGKVHMEKNMDPTFRKYIDDVLLVCSARARFVIETILAKGSITSEELRDAGYVHGARAIGDVRDNGVPLVTLKTKSSHGKSIARYVFGDTNHIKRHKFGGRKSFPASLKNKLIQRDGETCRISAEVLPAAELQIDHRIPYYISGDIGGDKNADDFMLLSRSMQRAKSWACEHCANAIDGNVEVCRSCYWAYPEDYTHVAMKNMRALYVTWEGDEAGDFDAIRLRCREEERTIQDYLKDAGHERLS